MEPTPRPGYRHLLMSVAAEALLSVHKLQDLSNGWATLQLWSESIFHGKPLLLSWWTCFAGRSSSRWQSLCSLPCRVAVWCAQCSKGRGETAHAELQDVSQSSVTGINSAVFLYLVSLRGYRILFWMQLKAVAPSILHQMQLELMASRALLHECASLAEPSTTPVPAADVREQELGKKGEKSRSYLQESKIKTFSQHHSDADIETPLLEATKLLSAWPPFLPAFIPNTGKTSVLSAKIRKRMKWKQKEELCLGLCLRSRTGCAVLHSSPAPSGAESQLCGSSERWGSVEWSRNIGCVPCNQPHLLKSPNFIALFSNMFVQQTNLCHEAKHNFFL